LASEIVQQNATSVTVGLFIADSASSPVGMGKTGLTNATTGLKIYYQRRGEAPVAISLVNLTSPLIATSAWTSGGFKEIDATNTPGRYRLDVPNAAFASGNTRVTITVTGAGTIDDEVSVIDLVAYDPTTVDKTGFSLSAAGIQGIWDALTSALTTTGSVGKRIADNLDVTVSSRLPATSYTPPPTAQNIWDTLVANQTTTGSLGKLLKDNIDAAISSRLATAGYTAPDNTDILAIKAKTDNLPAAPAAVSDIPTANTIRDAVMNRVFPLLAGGTLTFAQVITLLGAPFANKSNGPLPGVSGTVNLRNGADTANLAAQAVDTSGYHTANPTLTLGGA
jgi:hypothetical protein